MKGYKVATWDRSTIIGVAAKSFDELMKKACNKLGVDVMKTKAYLPDGTRLYDCNFFLSLPNQSLIILLQPGESIGTLADVLLSTLQMVNMQSILGVGKIAKKLFSDENMKKKLIALSEVLNECTSACKDNESTTTKTFVPKSNAVPVSLREEDPEWFEDLDTNARTKEEYMRIRCKGRIQSYFYNSRDELKRDKFILEQLKKGNPYDYDDSFTRFWGEIYNRLKTDEFCGYYFDRSSCKSICDGTGLFTCEGMWNKKVCQYPLHVINPYRNKEERILFGMWNLDHTIERRRSIVPSLAEAFLSHSLYDDSINGDYFYELLFTRKNLKLVHIVCHDKKKHSTARCDSEKIILMDVPKWGTTFREYAKHGKRVSWTRFSPSAKRNRLNSIKDKAECLEIYTYLRLPPKTNKAAFDVASYGLHRYSP